MLKIRKQQVDLLGKALLKEEGDSLVVKAEGPLTPEPTADGILRIRKEQDEAFSYDRMKRFVYQSIEMLEERFPQWCHGGTHEDKFKFVASILEFGHQHYIYQEVNLQKLMAWKLEYSFEIPLSEYLESIIKREHFPEDYRLERFHEALETAPLTQIYL